MRLLVLFGLLAACLNVSRATFSQVANQSASVGSGAQLSDIGKSGSEFVRVCSHIGGDAANNPQRMQSDATCEGWVEGFVDGFAVHDELLGVPRGDRLVCISRNATNAQIIQAIERYIRSNPDKAHRATRLVAALALAQAFPCKRAK